MNDEHRSQGHFLNEQQGQDAIAQNVEGYRQQPETDEEIALAQQLSGALLTQEPWALGGDL